MTSTAKAYDCKICSHPLEVITGKVATCSRCGHRDHSWTHRSARLCLVFSLTALILYVPANVFPFMTIELYGRRNSSTIWDGIVSLMDQRSYAIAAIVFLASILIPVLKLLILFYLSASAGSGQSSKFKMGLYHFVEAIGRWSMLDIFLLAVMVAIVKLGKFTTVEPEPGSAFFLAVVIFTMMASAYFDPRTLWTNENEKTHTP
jgi:paraquat-inducible protein A